MVLIALSGILIQGGPVSNFIQKYQCIQMKYIICKQHINHKMIIILQCMFHQCVLKGSAECELNVHEQS